MISIIFRRQNEDRISQFLSTHPEARLDDIKDAHLMPLSPITSKHSFDTSKLLKFTPRYSNTSGNHFNYHDCI